MAWLEFKKIGLLIDSETINTVFYEEKFDPLGNIKWKLEIVYCCGSMIFTAWFDSKNEVEAIVDHIRGVVTSGL